MKLFLSWSGEPSRAVAKALHEWLPNVIQSVKPWMSAEDIEVGQRWADEIQGKLQDYSFAVLCLTPENQARPWINFEAGAISKAIQLARVCPYAFNLRKTEIKWPLAMFQAAESDEDGTRALVRSINNAQSEGALDAATLERTFSKWWPELKGILEKIPPASSPAAPARQLEDMVSETLDLVRQMARSGDGFRFLLPQFDSNDNVRRWLHLPRSDESWDPALRTLLELWLAKRKGEVSEPHPLHGETDYAHRGEFLRREAEREAREAKDAKAKDAPEADTKPDPKKK